jgi:hypothetical protein
MKSRYQKACDNLTTLLTNDNIKFLGKAADATARTILKLSEPTSGKLWRYTNSQNQRLVSYDDTHTLRTNVW